jgi:hypothetical protein
MKKFAIESKKNKTTIFEVEIVILTAMDDPSIAWRKPEEYKASILKPTTFHQKMEKIVDGKKETVLVPDVWCWHSFFESLEEARIKAVDLIMNEFKFNLRKYGKSYTELDVAQAVNAIEVVLLKA